MSATVLSAPPAIDQEPARRLRPVADAGQSRRPRVLYGVVAVLGVVLIGAAQMGLSILTAQTSYEIADLKAQQRTVALDQQVLEEEVAGLGSPQYLAANAASLGMVTGETPNFLRLSDATISSSNAAGGTSSIDVLGDDAVANSLIEDIPLVTDPSVTYGEGDTADEDLLAENPTPPTITDGLPSPDTH